MPTVIISCPSCNSRFNVAESEVAKPEGRFVRCTICEYEWLAVSTNYNLHHIETTKKKRPFSSKNINTKYYTIYIICLIIIGIAATYFMKNLIDGKYFLKSYDPITKKIHINNITYSTEGQLSNQKKQLLNTKICLKNISKQDINLNSIQLIGLDFNKIIMNQSIDRFTINIPPSSAVCVTMKMPFHKITPSYIALNINHIVNPIALSNKQKLIPVILNNH